MAGERSPLPRLVDADGEVVRDTAALTWKAVAITACRAVAGVSVALHRIADVLEEARAERPG